jgi:hypothetical protein
VYPFVCGQTARRPPIRCTKDNFTSLPALIRQLAFVAVRRPVYASAAHCNGTLPFTVRPQKKVTCNVEDVANYRRSLVLLYGAETVRQAEALLAAYDKLFA